MPSRARAPRTRAPRTRYVTTQPFMACPAGRLVKIGPDQVAHIATPTPDGTGYRWDRIGLSDQHPWISEAPPVTDRVARARPDWPTQ